MITKPPKPTADFPLFPHQSGQWCKKIRGKAYYFGVWSDPETALGKYQRMMADLQAGRPIKRVSQPANVRTLCCRFLADKSQLLESDELTLRSFNDYADSCKRIIEHFGKTRLLVSITTDDFAGLREKLSKTRGPVSLGNEINRIRTVFRYAAPDRAGMIKEPIKFGPMFRRPSKKSQRINKSKRPSRLVHPHEVQRLASAASPQLRAMIMLAINSGMGNSDCAGLRTHHIDLDRGWIDYPRPKTGAGRRAKLWPETVIALRQAIVSRPADLQQSIADLVFVTRHRKPWHHDQQSSCPIANAFARIRRQTGIIRPGVTFYSLRHTFQTIAKRCGDTDAVRAVMGHVDGTIGAVYDEEFTDDARLQRVASTVKQWLDQGSTPVVLG